MSVYSPPIPIKKANPRYPARARARGIEGWVQLHYMVDPSGNTYDIEIVGSNGDQSIERAAIKAARKYKYRPGEYEGEPTDANNICDGIFREDLVATVRLPLQQACERTAE